jgi:GNAT superfamily N-acetyltransferase
LISSNKPLNSGWDRRTTTIEQWYQCPACQLEAQSLVISESGGWKCYRCGAEHRVEDLGSVDKTVALLTCHECGNEVSATPGNLYSYWGYICPKCKNTVAITFEGELVQPNTVFSVDWNHEIQMRSKDINEELRIAEVESERDLLIVHVMQSMAREEGEPFLGARLEEHGCCLVFHSLGRMFLGYVLWSDDESEATLRQIYVVPEERRKGFAAGLLTYWVREYADRIGARFAVESPNEKSVALLVKLGFASADATPSSEHKCFFVGGM